MPLLSRPRLRLGFDLFALQLGLGVALFSMLGCVSQVQPWYEIDPGNGRLLFIRHHAEKTGPRTALEVHTRAGTTVLPVDEPRIARWLDPNTILVLAGGSAADADAPDRQLIHVDVSTGATTVVRAETSMLDIEPSADGRKLAWVRSVGGTMAHALEVEEMNPAGEPVVASHEGFDGPRWGPLPRQSRGARYGDSAGRCRRAR